ncbi:MAG TPA: hypothetical protein VHN99_05185 [Deinococcales bacterium]|nr:hypothetical protein [Deinococcales bacterium]
MNGPQAPRLLLAVPVTLAFWFAAFGLVSMLAGPREGLTLWPLEVLAGLAAGAGAYALFNRVQAGTAASPRHGTAERTVQRLAYRRGAVLSLDLVARETFLDDLSAAQTLQGMVRDGLAERLDDGTYRIR